MPFLLKQDIQSKLGFDLYTLLVYTYKSEGDLLNTSAGFSKISSDQRGCYIEAINHLGQKHIIKIPRP